MKKKILFLIILLFSTLLFVVYFRISEINKTEKKNFHTRNPVNKEIENKKLKKKTLKKDERDITDVNINRKKEIFDIIKKLQELRLYSNELNINDYTKKTRELFEQLYNTGEETIYILAEIIKENLNDISFLEEAFIALRACLNHFSKLIENGNSQTESFLLWFLEQDFEDVKIYRFAINILMRFKSKKALPYFERMLFHPNNLYVPILSILIQGVVSVKVKDSAIILFRLYKDEKFAKYTTTILRGLINNVDTVDDLDWKKNVAENLFRDFVEQGGFGSKHSKLFQHTIAKLGKEAIMDLLLKNIYGNDRSLMNYALVILGAQEDTDFAVDVLKDVLYSRELSPDGNSLLQAAIVMKTLIKYSRRASEILFDIGQNDPDDYIRYTVWQELCESRNNLIDFNRVVNAFLNEKSDEVRRAIGLYLGNYSNEMKANKNLRDEFIKFVFEAYSKGDNYHIGFRNMLERLPYIVDDPVPYFKSAYEIFRKTPDTFDSSILSLVKELPKFIGSEGISTVINNILSEPSKEFLEYKKELILGILYLPEESVSVEIFDLVKKNLEEGIFDKYNLKTMEIGLARKMKGFERRQIIKNVISNLYKKDIPILFYNDKFGKDVYEAELEYAQVLLESFDSESLWNFSENLK